MRLDRPTSQLSKAGTEGWVFTLGLSDRSLDHSPFLKMLWPLGIDRSSDNWNPI